MTRKELEEYIRSAIISPLMQEEIDNLTTLFEQERVRAKLSEWESIKALILANQHHKTTKWLEDIADRSINFFKEESQE